MDRETKKVSFNLDVELWKEVQRRAKAVPRVDQTVVLNELIADGLRLRELEKRTQRKEEFLLMKILYILRSLTATRGEGVLEALDVQFSEELEILQQLIFEQGMDYVGR